MKVRTDFTLNVPRDVAWDLMAERFADIGEWSDTVVASRLEGPLAPGSVRTCELKPTPTGLSEIQERLTKFDRGGHSFAFDIIAGLPGFMRRVSSQWTLTAAGPSQTRAQSLLTIEVAWWMWPMLPMIRSQFRRTLAGFMQEIEAVAAHTHRPVEPAPIAV